MNTIDPEFEQSAFDAFTATMGEAGLEAYRGIVSKLGPSMAVFHCGNLLKLSSNDWSIFKAVAHRLHREAQPA